MSSSEIETQFNIAYHSNSHLITGAAFPFPLQVPSGHIRNKSISMPDWHTFTFPWTRMNLHSAFGRTTHVSDVSRLIYCGWSLLSQQVDRVCMRQFIVSGLRIFLLTFLIFPAYNTISATVSNVLDPFDVCFDVSLFIVSLLLIICSWLFSWFHFMYRSNLVLAWTICDMTMALTGVDKGSSTNHIRWWQSSLISCRIMVTAVSDVISCHISCEIYKTSKLNLVISLFY